jgi:flagellar protein FlgJ
MGPSPLDSQTGTALNGLASDARSLDQLRRAANEDPAKAVKQVATQFEALFMQMVLKSMRDATPKSGMLDSSEEQTYTSMLDEQLAQKIAAGGTGLADVIARQLSRNLPTAATPGATAAVTPGVTPGVNSAAGIAGAGNAAAAATGSGAPAPIKTPAKNAAAGLASPGSVLTNLHAAAAVRGPR